MNTESMRKRQHKIRVTLMGSKPEEADCLVTEDYLVIETEEPIKIPFLRHHSTPSPQA